MRYVEGYMREKMHMSLNKLIVVRNMTRTTKIKDENGKVKTGKDLIPLYRVVANYYFHPSESMVNLKLGGKQKTFHLRLDCPLYFRSETQVYVIDFDTSEYLSFSNTLVLGMTPEELHEMFETGQIARLLRPKKGDSDSLLTWVFVIGCTAAVCVALGIFAGMYIESHSAASAVLASPTPEPILIP